MGRDRDQVPMHVYGVALVLSTTAAAAVGRYAQDEFILSGYLDPPLNEAAYEALAAANFTGVFGDR